MNIRFGAVVLLGIFIIINVTPVFAATSFGSLQIQLQSLLAVLEQYQLQHSLVSATTVAPIATSTLRHCDVTFTTWIYGKTVQTTRTVYGNATDTFAIGLSLGSVLPYTEKVAASGQSSLGYFDPQQYVKNETALDALHNDHHYEIMSALLANTNSPSSGTKFPNAAHPYVEARVVNSSIVGYPAGNFAIYAEVDNCVAPQPPKPVTPPAPDAYAAAYGPADYAYCMAHIPQAPTSTDGDTSINFVAFGDAHVTDFNPAYEKYPELNKNKMQIEAINSLSNYKWPVSFKGVVKNIDRLQGVVVAGDLTNNGDAPEPGFVSTTTEYSEYLKMYGLCGDKMLKYPVYDSFGNHEFAEGAPASFGHPVIDNLVKRVAFRQQMHTITNSSGPHYSWDWGNIHFVDLNLKASNATDTLTHDSSRNGHTVRPVDPEGALTFLIDDLAKYVGTSKKGVIVIAHFPYPHTEINPDQTATKLLSTKELNALTAVLNKYNTIALIHGHTHDAPQQYVWNGITVFDVGTPMFYAPKSYGLGQFTLFKITPNYLQAANVSWSVVKTAGQFHLGTTTIGQIHDGSNFATVTIPIKVPAWK